MKNARSKIQLKSYSDHGQTHAHDHHQLVLPLVGKLSLSVNSRAGEVAEGRAAIIAAGQDHDFEARDDNRFVVSRLVKPRMYFSFVDGVTLFIVLGD